MGMDAVPSHRIAIVDDDADLSACVRNIMAQNDYALRVYSSSVKFVKELHFETFDAVILDWMMPEMTGLEVLRHIKEFHPDLPVLLLTSRSDDNDIIQGLRSGADDFVSKPANPEVLLARVDALLRRFAVKSPDNAQIIRVDPYVLDNAEGRVTCAGQEITLTNREFQLAWLLFRNVNRPLSRQYLLERLWGKLIDLQTRTLDTHVGRLRVKLKLGASNGVKLTALYGFGYRLDVSPEKLDCD